MKAYKLSNKQKRWLLSLHILFVTAWLGGTLCMLALMISGLHADNFDTLFITRLNVAVLDEAFIKFPALGTLITGLLLSVFSNWGLTNYPWIVLKAVLTVLIIIFGIVGLSDWSAQAIDLLSTGGWAAAQQPAYVNVRNLTLFGAVLNSLLMGGMVIISSLKPWGRWKVRGQHSPV